MAFSWKTPAGRPFKILSCAPAPAGARDGQDVRRHSKRPRTLVSDGEGGVECPFRRLILMEPIVFRERKWRKHVGVNGGGCQAGCAQVCFADHRKSKMSTQQCSRVISSLATPVRTHRLHRQNISRGTFRPSVCMISLRRYGFDLHPHAKYCRREKNECNSSRLYDTWISIYKEPLSVTRLWAPFSLRCGVENTTCTCSGANPLNVGAP